MIDPVKFKSKLDSTDSKWRETEVPLQQRLISLRQVRIMIIESDIPELFPIAIDVDRLIIEYEDKLLPDNMRQVEDSLMQIQNITSMFFHDQHVDLPDINTRLQDQKKTYMMLKTLMSRIHTQLYPDGI